MKLRTFKFFFFLLSAFNFTTTTIAKPNNKSSKITGEEITYVLDGITFKGFIAYDAATSGKRPGVLVVHEWWGSNEYVRMRARKLAESGYIAMAVDMFGDGKVAGNPQEAMQLAGQIYKDPKALKSRMEAAEQKLKTYSQVDPDNIAAIGYCFGGFVVLNAAKMGMDLKGVVSFHGGLTGVQADKSLLKAKILVCHGGADKFESDEEISNFKKQMDSVGADYTFKVYPGATHAFTNPASDENGKKFNMPIAYNEAADKKSWEDMKMFFSKIFTK